MQEKMIVDKSQYFDYHFYMNHWNYNHSNMFNYTNRMFSVKEINAMEPRLAMEIIQMSRSHVTQLGLLYSHWASSAARNFMQNDHIDDGIVILSAERMIQMKERVIHNHIKRRSYPSKFYEILLDHRRAEVACTSELLAHRDCPSYILNDVSKWESLDYSDLLSLAKNPMTPVEALIRIMEDGRVNQYLLSNPNFPKEYRMQLMMEQ